MATITIELNEAGNNKIEGQVFIESDEGMCSSQILHHGLYNLIRAAYQMHDYVYCDCLKSAIKNVVNEFNQSPSTIHGHHQN